MKALFVELPPFERKRATYLEDDSFREFQDTLFDKDEADDLTAEQRKFLKALLKTELTLRNTR